MWTSLKLIVFSTILQDVLPKISSQFESLKPHFTKIDRLEDLITRVNCDLEAVGKNIFYTSNKNDLQNISLMTNSIFKIILILLGTKIDLREDKEALQALAESGQSPIKREQGQKLANKIRAVKYLECSALTQRGLKQV